MASDLYFIKFVARDSIQRTFVIFAAIANKQKNTIEKFETVVSHSPELININSDYTYKDVVNRIQKFIFEGNHVQSATLTLANSFRNSFTSESYMVELMYYLEYENSEKLNELIKQNLAKVLWKGEYLINTIFHSIEREEIDASAVREDSIEKPKEKDLEEGLIPPGSLVAKFTYVLSPVTGSRVDELKIGDRIMVKFAPDDEVSSNVINLLSLKDDGGIIRPVPATVVDIKKYPKEVDTIIKVTDGVFGRYKEVETTVKVKMAGFETLATTVKRKTDSEILEDKPRRQFHFNMGTIGIAAILGLLLVAWIIAYVFL
ncbi:MAG: hypothetical protein KBA66_11160 [Leptospiraceae bacterium]|nr:hypothetical protein [Leptospiraceae bacterium]